MKRLMLVPTFLTLALALLLPAQLPAWETVFSDDFNDGNADGWEEISGTWEVDSLGYYYGFVGTSVAGKTIWTDILFEVDARASSFPNIESLVFHCIDEDNFYWIQIDHGNQECVLLLKADGEYTVLLRIPYEQDPDQWHHLSLTVLNDSIHVDLDYGTASGYYIDHERPLPNGKIGLHPQWGVRTDYDNVIVQAPIISTLVVPDTTEVRRGGRLGFTAWVGNNTDDTHVFQGWTEGETPWGLILSPLLGPQSLILGGGGSFSAHLYQPIHPRAPLGGPYIYSTVVGEYPDSVYDRDSFEFYVVP
jgi:hypothetical protein